MDGPTFAFDYDGFPHLVEQMLVHVPYESLIAWRGLCRGFRDFIDKVLSYDVTLSMEIQYNDGGDLQSVRVSSNHPRSPNNHREAWDTGCKGRHPLQPRFLCSVEVAPTPKAQDHANWSFLSNTRHLGIMDYDRWGWSNTQRLAPLLPHLAHVRLLTISSSWYIRKVDVGDIPIKADTVKVIPRPYEFQPGDNSFNPRYLKVTYPEVRRAELQFSIFGHERRWHAPLAWSPLTTVFPPCLEELVVIFEADIHLLKYNRRYSYRSLLTHLVRDIAYAFASVTPRVKCSVIGIEQLEQVEKVPIASQDSIPVPEMRELLLSSMAKVGKTIIGWSDTRADEYTDAVTFLSHPDSNLPLDTISTSGEDEDEEKMFWCKRTKRWI